MASASGAANGRYQDSLSRRGPTDFERRDSKVRYLVNGGVFVISYENGFPIGKFEP